MMKLKMPVWLLVIVVAIGSLLLIGCQKEVNTADDDMAKLNAEMQEEAIKEVGFPAIVNMRELRLLKHIYELRDQEDLLLHAYNYSPYTGLYTYLGRCIGYGLPYGVQFSNPMRDGIVGNVKAGTPSRHWDLIPQPEPNMLFPPDGVDATWILLVGDNGEPKVCYMEPKLTVVPFKLPKRLVMNPPVGY